MKRILCTLMSIIMIASLVACQPTPDKPVVIQKDADRLLNSARNGAGEEWLREQYGIPEHYQYEFKEGKLSISVDARVIVPDSDRMPIYRVRQTAFTQEIVDSFYQELIGDTEMWLYQSPSKEDILDQILRVKRQIAEIEANPQSADEYFDLAFYESTLEELDELMELASDTVQQERADGQLRETYDIYWNTTYSGFEALQKPYKHFGENNDTAYGKQFSVRNDTEKNIFYIIYGDGAQLLPENPFYNAPSLPVAADTDVSADTLAKAGLKPSEAVAMVKAFLDRAGVDMVVDSIYLRSNAQVWVNDGNVRPADSYLYDVNCVRVVDGYNCSFVMDGSDPINDGVAPPWGYERLFFSVNNQGIVRAIWLDPIEVIEKVIDDTQLMPFSEISEIFERMMRIKFAPHALAHDKADFEINRITLSLHRIVEKDSNETGLLIPAWNFYGKLTTTYSNMGESYTSEDTAYSFMTINAIDGSVIDTEKGY